MTSAPNAVFEKRLSDPFTLGAPGVSDSSTSALTTPLPTTLAPSAAATELAMRLRRLMSTMQSGGSRHTE
ncbi:hypothetical protein GCM10009021_11800 [Halarchaeum nitratireducens]|uniref:Uncharacterized protein n=1 Tax=Halarchaeum nitratireducens TaxID=489913 RepID=A0A830GA44_9EURY|nr:hypothetical protein GCM10009021_11800 [Halarchaeum nitratireducens]